MELVRSVHETASPSGLVPNGGGNHGRRDVFHVTFDPGSESPVEVVLDAVAVVHDRQPEDLAPLHDAVDPEALDELVVPSSDHQAGADEVRFVYEGLEISIDGDGNVWLQRV